MTGLLALALALAPSPGCEGAVAEASALAPGELASRAAGIVERLDVPGVGGPVTALARAAREAEGAAREGPGAEEAARRFRAALARHCALAAAPRPADAGGADRAELERILSRPEYRRTAGDPDVVRRAVLELWARLFEALGTAEAERYASVVRAVFLAAVLAAAALLLVALRRRRPDRPGRAAEAPAPRARAAREAGPARAAEALARGDAREAVRQALLGAVASLERAERIPGGRALALTNAEIVAAVSGGATGPGGLHGEVERLVRLFDRTIYGGQPATLDEARAAVEGALRVDALEGAPR